MEMPMKSYRKFLVGLYAVLPLALSCTGLLTLAGCDRGAGEKAGEKVDEAVKDAGRAVEDATD
jgi:hypothetical protein